MTDIVDRLNDVLSGRYRLEGELGEGGMATVYVAEDLKHDRKVAIKVLRPELAAVIGADRFVTEIKTTAQLQHPHILPLFDSGKAEGFLYYVMPYIEGESLRDKLDREKQLGVEEALELTKSVADALDYAHRKGVIHRDIKPGNVLLHDGRPVVADFGIAVALSAAGGGRLTETGLSLGTPHYMSPEQATADRDLTARSDVYSLACVLYEMLTGDPPHAASTVQAVLARILTEPPRPVTAVRASVPAHVSDALEKALEKLPADRFASVADFRDALDDVHFAYAARSRTAAPATSGRRTSREEDRPWLSDVRSKLAVAGIVLAGLAGVVVGRALSGGGTPLAPDGAVVHRYVVSDSALADINFDLSSRGDLAYQAQRDGVTRLRLRRASDAAVEELPGTDGGWGPVFSPAGDWIAFAADGGALKKIQPATGTVVTLVPEGDLVQALPSDWTEDGDILFRTAGGLYRIPEIGGEPELLLDESAALRPRMSPDGRSLLYTSGLGRSTVRILDLEDGTVDSVVARGGNAQWSPTGHIVHGHSSGTLFAIPFDLDRQEVTGPAVPVREGVFTYGDVSFFEISRTGSLAYLVGDATGSIVAGRSIAWLNMAGTSTPLPIEPTDHPDMRLSPDGGHLAYTRGGEIYLFDLDIGTNRRFTFQGYGHHDPVWSPDGTRIAFSSESGGVWLKDADGGSDAEPLVSVEVGGAWSVWAWLEDGTLVLTRGLDEETDILMTRVDAPEIEPTPLLEAEWRESSPALSPDGTLMAYVSSEVEGDPHVFVREFPGLGGRWQVSEQPVYVEDFAGILWANDGSALFYQAGQSGRVIRADVARDPAFRVVGRTELFDPTWGVVLEDLSPDGERFLSTRPAGTEGVDDVRREIVVAVNWITELRERLSEND